VEVKFPAELQQVVNLLEKMGETQATQYPLDLLTQRQEFFQAAISAAGAAASSGNAAANSSPLQIVLATVLAGELVLGAYFTRDLWLPLLSSQSPTPEASEVFQPYPAEIKTEIPTATIIPTETEFATPTAMAPIAVTPAATLGAAPADPPPKEPKDKDNPGNHLGQTPGPPDAPGKDKKP
jgi:hypothetical protein